MSVKTINITIDELIEKGKSRNFRLEMESSYKNSIELPT